MSHSEITIKEFNQFKEFIYNQVGIYLAESKIAMVSGRLDKRVRHYELSSFSEYFKLIVDPTHVQEKQVAIDLLTTNETHFFREPKHFDFLRDNILANRVKGKPFRVWSAASSSGEEPYTIAMVLAEHLKSDSWEVVASDVSTRMLHQAQRGCYPIKSAEEIPMKYLTKYCLKGTGVHAKDLLIAKELRQRVRFLNVNLTQPFPDIGEFDVIFLRNVMIYFDLETKQKILQKMTPMLAKGGYFMISHSESLNGIGHTLTQIQAAIYRK